MLAIPRGSGSARLTRAALFTLTILVSSPLTPAQIVVDDDCTLVDAVTSANDDAAIGGCTSGSGADQIVLTADVVLTESIDGENGLPSVRSDITLRGNGFGISRDPSAPEFRIIAIDDPSNTGVLSLKNVTLSGGSLSSGVGGAIHLDGGEYSSLVLTQTTVSNNLASFGGGIFVSSGEASVVDSVIADNQALVSGGGIFKEYGDSGYVDLISSTISGNSAYEAGGGLHTWGSYYIFGYGGSTLVRGSTFTGNSAGTGGAIYSGGNLTLVNSTVSGNHGESGAGGLTTYSYLYETNDIVHSTITNNTTGTGSVAGIFDLSRRDQKFTIESSIVAANPGGNCLLTGNPADIRGSNFTDDATCGASFDVIIGLDPDLDSNGGPTETHALLADSNAVNAAGDCGLDVDQRGLTRSDGSCDSGSFELDAGPLSVEGTCPGLMTVTAKGATPNTQLELFQGAVEGASQVPDGPCMGTELKITDPQSIAVLILDGTGGGSLVLDLTDPDCGQLLQGVTERDCAATNVAEMRGCNLLSLRHTGDGADPIPSPISSTGCATGRYQSGEVVDLTALPDVNWEVEAWTGTDDDDSTDAVNTLTMPGTDHAVTVDYKVVCRNLVLKRSGEGNLPLASPSTEGCSTGKFKGGEVIALSDALPSPGWVVAGWIGTENDGSTDSTNVVTMPSNTQHTVFVQYEKICFDLLLSHSGLGTDPVASPTSSDGCPTSTYLPGETIALAADPAVAWNVSGWNGTDNDGSSSTTNTVTMPANDHAASVDYVPTCYSLTLEHTGSGSDPTAVPLADGSGWEQSPVAGDFEDIWGLRAADLDGDLDADIVAAALFQGVAWWENVAGDGGSWTKHVVANPVNGALGAFPADIDGDGDLDLVVPAFFDDAILWWENANGDGTVWSEHLVGALLDKTRAAHAADLDGDGDLDILGTGEQDDTVRWFENQTGDGSSWLGHTLTESLNSASSVEAEDLDGDGDLDVLAGGLFGAVAWFDNLAGDASSWEVHQLESSSFSTAVSAADLDGDSDADILSTFGWWENTAGDASDWVAHPVGRLAGAHIPTAADLDNDGDLDTLGVDETNDTFSWSENLAGDATAWIEHTVAPFARAFVLDSADLDGDGTPDLVGGGDAISWWRNRYGGTCPAGSYRAEDRLALTASPGVGWEVAGWTGTEDDDSTELTNLAVMPGADHTISVDYVESAPVGPAVSITGTCPGQIDVTATKAVPDRTITFYAGGGGTSQIPGGACGGTELDLSPARRWKVRTADSSGETSFSFTATAGWCSRVVQAVDADCSTSNLADIP